MSLPGLPHFYPGIDVVEGCLLESFRGIPGCTCFRWDAPAVNARARARHRARRHTSRARRLRGGGGGGSARRAAVQGKSWVGVGKSAERGKGDRQREAGRAGGAGAGHAPCRPAMTVLTESYLRDLCRKEHLYASCPELNDVLRLQRKGISRIEALEKYTGLKVRTRALSLAASASRPSGR